MVETAKGGEVLYAMLCAWRHPLNTSVSGGATLHAVACYEYHEAFVMRALLAINQKVKWGRRNGQVCVHYEGSSILKLAKLGGQGGTVFRRLRGTISLAHLRVQSMRIC